MKERPIIFSTDMVKAIIDGRKTMTRRVIKLPKTTGQPIVKCEDCGDWAWQNDKGFWHHLSNLAYPYGQVGDKLWVKETCDYIFGNDGDYILYKADADGLKYFEELKKAGSKVTWKPSIFMPRDLSRITLEITRVRVERLQDITLQDMIAEGAPYFPNHIIGFKELWDSLNAKRGYSWEENPWVWVIEFKKL